MNLFSVRFGRELKTISLPPCCPCSSCHSLSGSKGAAELAAQDWATGTMVGRSQRHPWKVTGPGYAAPLLGGESCDQEICFRDCLRAYKSPVRGSGCWQLASAVIVETVYYISSFLKRKDRILLLGIPSGTYSVSLPGGACCCPASRLCSTVSPSPTGAWCTQHRPVG